MAMPPDRAERRPRREDREGSGVQDDGAGGNVKTNLQPDDVADLDDIAAQLRRRREASWRLPPLESGYRDPLDQRAAS